MLITLILMSVLLSGAAVMVSMQTRSTRDAGMMRSKMSALNCAEAGLVIARSTVAANYGLWNDALAQGTEPSWLAALDHDLDDDGAADFTITLRDNNDEIPDDQTRDNDLSIFIVSTCIKFPDTPAEVTELVRFNGGGNCYNAQLGGCGGNANAN
jgi:hypothetical protein